MRDPDLRMALPLLGVHEAAGKVDQPPGTTRIALNARGVDPKSGEVRLSTRAGSARFMGDPVDPDGRRVDHVDQVSYLQPVREWRALNPPSDELLSSLPEDAVDVVFGPENDLYVLRASGAVVIFNRAGVVVRTLPSRTAVGFRTVPRLQVDEQGAVYTGSKSEVLLDGAASRLFRQVRQFDDADRSLLFWEQPIEGELRDFSYRAGAIDLIEHGLESEEEGDRAWTTRLLNLAAGQPLQVRRRRVGFPASAVAIDEFGATFVSCLPNPNRTGTGFDERAISWTPRELGDWKTRLRTWLRPISSDYEDGQQIVEMGDERLRESSLGVTDDARARPFRRDNPGRRAIYDAPTWDLDAFGGLGGARFQSNTAMVSTVTNGAGPDQQGTLFPGDAPYLFAGVFEVPQGDDVRVLSQVGGAGQPAYRLEVTPDGTRTVTLSVTNRDGVTTNLVGTYPEGVDAFIVTLQYPSATAPAIYRITGTYQDSAVLGDLTVNSGYPLSIGQTQGTYTALGRPLRANALNLAPLVSAFGAQGNGGLTFGSAAQVLVDEVEASELNDSNGLLIQDVRLDLGVVGKITAFELVQAGPLAGQDNATSVQIQVGDSITFDNVTYEEEFSVNPGVNVVYGSTHALTTPQDAQFIRVRVLGQTLAYVSEFRLYDHFDEGPDGEFGFFEGLVYMGGTAPGEGVNGTAPIGSAVSDVTDAEAIEGYLAHQLGIAELLPADHPFFGVGNVPVGIGDFAIEQNDLGTLSAPSGFLAKFDSTGKLQGILTSDNVGGGLGFGHALGPDGSVYTLGAGDVHVRRIIDEGTFLRGDGEGTWTYKNDQSALAYAQGYNVDVSPLNATTIPANVISDVAGQLFVTLLGQGAPMLTRFSPEGDLSWSFPVHGATRPVALAPTPAEPFYGSAELAGPDLIYGAVGSRVRAFRVAEEFGPVRSRRRQDVIVAVADGEVWASPWDGDVRLLAMQHVGSLQKGQQLRAARLQANLFFVDGEQVQVFDPEFLTMERLEPSGSGEVLHRATDVASWNGRLVLTDGYEWTMSRVGDFRDWNQVQVELDDEGQSTSSAVSQLGQVPDRVTGILPLRDDLLLWLCEESIWRLNGNPITNGYQDRVSEDVGVASRAWCRSPDGTAFVLTSRGNLAVLNQFGIPVPFLGDRISRRLELLDLDRFRAWMVWSELERGFHVFYVDREECSKPDQFALFLERPVEGKPWGIFYDTWESVNVMPTAAYELKGTEASQRLLLLGCEDGRLRVSAPNRPDDDGHSIPFRVRVGPMTGNALESKVKGVYGVLASDSGRVGWELRGSDVADAPGPVKGSGVWRAGRNAPSTDRVRGASVWLDMIGVPGEACSIEEVNYRVQQDARKQPR